MIFWITTIALSLLAILWIVLPVLRGGQAAADRSSYDIQVYKDQLKEVERDLARGVITDAEATASRTEISRRLLGAADKASARTVGKIAPKAANIGVGVAIAVLTIGGFALYTQIGAPGLRDLPLTERLANRPTQEQAEDQARLAQGEQPQIDPEHLALVNQLRDALADRPTDLTGYRLLADNLAQLGLYADARAAQDQVITILGDSATAEDHAAHAEIMIIAAGWYVSPAAESALTKAAQLDRTNPRARFYIGMAMLQRGNPEQTYQIWSNLQAEGHQQPWMGIINAELDNVAAQAGITRGPSAADIDAAEDMSVEDRMAMIQGMVESLSTRLATDGGTPDEWAQLIRALGVLGETDQAALIWAESQSVFAGNDDAIATIRTAAENAGVAE